MNNTSNGGRFRARSAALGALTALVLAGCGGGGGSPGATFPASPAPSPTAPAPAPAPSSPDTIVQSDTVANFCDAPRAGIDPVTRQPYPDRQGTLEQEKSWVRSWIDETYLWFDEIPGSVRAAQYSTPQTYFDALRTPAVTASGKPKDQFHFIYDTAVWQALSQEGVEAGYGFDLAILRAQPPRDIRIAYSDPGTPAALAGVGRGAKVLAVDGIDVVNVAQVDALNAALFPEMSGQSHSFKLQELDGSSRTVALVSANTSKVPVQNVRTLDTPTGKVGYLQFNDHIATSEAQLIAAIVQLKAAGVQDLVLDIRYNGGGLLDIASELAYMVATPSATAGATFERLQFNRKNPFGLTDAQTVTPFHAVSQGFSTSEGQALPQLGLSKVTVLTGPDTCSASEAIINGLRGVDVQVNIIGETTCGKPYGFLPADNCGTTYFAIQFSGVNNKGFGDYADGIAPTCTVADDFSHALGDPTERRLAAALSYRATGACPPASTSLSKSLIQAGSGEALVSGKSLARGVRVLRGRFSRR
ncbi:MAG: S41 family peptidase [Ramlibacter sp.]